MIPGLRRYLGCAMITFLAVFSGVGDLSACNLILATSESGKAMTLLSSVPFREDGTTRILNLWRIDVDLSGFNLLAYLREHPDRSDFPKSALVLTESADGINLEQGKVLWISLLTPGPQQMIHADMCYSSNQSVVHVVVAASHTIHIELSLFSIPRKSNIAKWPMELKASNHDSWPKTIAPKAELKTIQASQRISRIKAAHLLEQQDGLLVVLSMEEAPLQFYYNISTSSWSKVSIKHEKID